MQGIKLYRKAIQDWLHGRTTVQPDPITFGVSIDIAQLVFNHEINLHHNNYVSSLPHLPVHRPNGGDHSHKH